MTEDQASLGVAYFDERRAFGIVRKIEPGPKERCAASLPPERLKGGDAWLQ